MTSWDKGNCLMLRRWEGGSLSPQIAKSRGFKCHGEMVNCLLMASLFCDQLHYYPCASPHPGRSTWKWPFLTPRRCSCSKRVTTQGVQKYHCSFLSPLTGGAWKSAHYRFKIIYFCLRCSCPKKIKRAGEMEERNPKDIHLLIPSTLWHNSAWRIRFQTTHTGSLMNVFVYKNYVCIKLCM